MKNILIVFILALSVSACKKSSELPPPSETGANKFGAKINGVIWEAKGFGPFPANDVLEARRFGNGDIIINARNFASSPTEKEFVIFVKGTTGPGTYDFNTNTSHPGFDASYAYYVVRRFTPENEWITSSSYPGSITFSRIDTVEHVISGTFQFQMNNWYNAPQPLTVTEGRFDIKYQ